MKNIIENILVKGSVIAGMAAMLLGAGACTKEESPLPEFPETQKLYFSPTENTKEITVSANYSWHLTSSALWCQFEDGTGLKTTVLSGEAGEFKSKVVISEEGMKPGQISDVAILEMQMEDEIRVFAEVYRSAKGYEFTLLDKEGKAIEEKDWVIEAGYGDYLPFQVKANFDFAVTAKPIWVEFKGQNGLTGEADKVVASSAIFNAKKGDVKYPVAKSDENVIVFSDKEGKVFFPVQVSFAGMPAEEVNFGGPSNRPDWKVSMDGKVFTQSDAGLVQGGGKTILKNYLSYNITALNDQFVPVFIEVVQGQYQETVNCSLDKEVPFESWMHLKGEKGQMKLTVDAAGSERKGFALVFTEEQLKKLGLVEHPETWYDVLIENVEDPETFKMTAGIKYEIAQFHLLAELNQKEENKAEAMQAFKITDNMLNELPVQQVTDPGEISNYGTDQIYSVVQTSNSLNIEHFMSGTMGTDWIFSAWNKNGEEKTGMIDSVSETILNIWFGMDGEDSIPAGDRIDIIFRNPTTYQNIKVLFIESNK